jgi:hypothetical protein
MSGVPAHPRYRCRFCGRIFDAWLPASREPHRALLLGHLSQAHRNQVGAYTARMHRTEDITPVAAEAYEVLEAEEAPYSTSVNWRANGSDAAWGRPAPAH